MFIICLNVICVIMYACLYVGVCRFSVCGLCVCSVCLLHVNVYLSAFQCIYVWADCCCVCDLLKIFMWKLCFRCVYVQLCVSLLKDSDLLLLITVCVPVEGRSLWFPVASLLLLAALKQI